MTPNSLSYFNLTDGVYIVTGIYEYLKNFRPFNSLNSYK